MFREVAMAKAFYIGHSLQSDIPDMVAALVRATPGLSLTWKEQFIPGASLRWQWDEATRKQKQGFEPRFQAPYYRELPRGGYDLVVMTDSVPRGGASMVQETIEYARHFHRASTAGNRVVQTYYYETWHCIQSGMPGGCAYDTQSPTRLLTWRKRLTADRPMWESIVAGVNKGVTSGMRPMRMIPGGTALAALSDAIAQRKVPGIGSYKELFADEIHLNPSGKYFIALVQYATLFKRSPVGLPYRISNRWGASYWDTPDWTKKTWRAPSAEAVRQMQSIAWEVVRRDSLTGVFA